MFFILSKTIGVLFILPNLLALVGSIGVVLLLTRWVSLGRKLVVGALVALMTCAMSPLGLVMLLPLESRFPAWEPLGIDPDGIVVLGGGIQADVSAARGTAVSAFGFDRLLTAAKLARQYPKARIVYSGGSPNLVTGDAREADFAVSIFTDLGISADRILVERNSRTTRENAEASKALANPQSGERWLLVTSAFHMPRSVGHFRKANFPVEPVPTGWLTGGTSHGLFRLDATQAGLFRVNLATREWIGLLAAWLTGQSTEFFPGPP